MFPRILPIVVFGFVSALSGLAAQAQVSPVRVRMEQSSKSDKSDSKTGSKTVQSRNLVIYVTNGSKEPLDLKVKYAFFGRGLVDRQIATMEEGELPVSVKENGTEKVSTPEVNAESEDPRPGTKQKDGKKMLPSGHKLVGQGVQVFNGDKLVAEAYEPASMKESFGKAPAAKRGEAKKK
jgi:hypothetical protein